MAQHGIGYSKDVADRILEQVSDGKSLRSICEAQDMPSRVTVFAWLREKPDFAEEYDRARKESATALVDDLVAITDRTDLDPNDKRVRMDARRWIASKVLPKLYGDKIAVTDNEGGPLVIGWAVGSADKA